VDNNYLDLGMNKKWICPYPALAAGRCHRRRRPSGDHDLLLWPRLVPGAGARGTLRQRRVQEGQPRRPEPAASLIVPSFWQVPLPAVILLPDFSVLISNRSQNARGAEALYHRLTEYQFCIAVSVMPVFVLIVVLEL
jgi:hypothetical protein